MGEGKGLPGRPRRKHYNLRTCREELVRGRRRGDFGV